MNCPNCNAKLKTVSVKGVVLDVCESCDGIWFDRDELSKIIFSSEEELQNSPLSESLIDDKTSHPADEDYRLCPKCSSLMNHVLYPYESSVLIDRCIKCNGIWLDDGEIKKIIDYIDIKHDQYFIAKIKEIVSSLKEETI